MGRLAYSGRIAALSSAALYMLSGCSAEATLPVGMERAAEMPRANAAGATSAPVGGFGLAGAPAVVNTAGSPSSRPDPPVADGGGVLSEVCASDKYRAMQTPLTIYTLFDESGSMLLWWLPVTDAFTRFLRDPRSAGINIGLKFFGADCDPTVYSRPDVAIAPLPENAEPIAAQLAARIPLAQTPTRQAMEGAAMALNGYAANHPDEKVVILLVTDAATGFLEEAAEDCFSTVTQASEVAATALAGDPSIQTYVLGLGNGASLNMLSRAGGTGDALNADPAASDAVVNAIHQIRRRALPCDYALPPGGEQSPKLVNLEFTAAADSTQAQTVPGVGSASACSPTTGGWYYDDAAQPKRIIACDSTCEAFDSAGEVNVVLGCPTIGPD